MSDGPIAFRDAAHVAEVLGGGSKPKDFAGWFAQAPTIHIVPWEPLRGECKPGESAKVPLEGGAVKREVFYCAAWLGRWWCHDNPDTFRVETKP